MGEQKKLGKYFLPSLTLILLFLTIEFYLPTIVTEQITKAISINLYSSTELTVKHHTRPAFWLFLGQIKHLSIEGSELEAPHLTVSKLLLEIDRLKFSLWELLAYGRLNILGSEGRIALTINEAELDKYLHRFYIDDQYNEIKLELDDDGPRISGEFKGEQFYLDCVFTVKQNSILTLSPKKMVATNPNTKSIIDKLGELTAYSLELGTLGIPLIVDELSIEEDYLYVFGSVSN